MNEILLNNQVIVYLLGESILFGLLLIAFVMTVGILVKWDFGSYAEHQFELERRAYLVMTILIFVFVVKFLLLIYFVFTIDSLSLLVPGAMCGAGVISANDYGMFLLFLKLAILFFVLLWMALNAYDLQAKNYPLFRAKSWLFVAIFLLATIESSVDFAYFSHIDTLTPVHCCSTLYGQLEGANPLPFGLDTKLLLILFYLLFFVVVGTAITNQRVLSAMATLLFVVIAYYSVVYFFGTYIYELPTHKCPFCMMQRAYYYVGYLVWGTLFGGAFLLLISAVMEIGLRVERPTELKVALLLLTVFVLLCSAYVAVYYLHTGVFL